MQPLKTKTERKTPNPKRTSAHSSMVCDRRKQLASLAGALAAQGDTAAAGLTERLEAVLEEGEQMPDVRFLLTLMQRLTRRSADDLDSTDSDSWKASMHLSANQFNCAKAKQELRTTAVKVRRTVVEIFGSKPVRKRFGLAERTPRGALDLAIETRRFVDRLADPELVLPEPILATLEMDPTAWADELRPGLERLEGLLDDKDQRRIAAGDGVIAREKALKKSAETYQSVARATEALFVLAGEPELARRLRPTRKHTKEKAGSKLVRSVAGLYAAAGLLLAWLRARLRGVATAAASILAARERKSPVAAAWALAQRSLEAQKT